MPAAPISTSTRSWGPLAVVALAVGLTLVAACGDSTGGTDDSGAQAVTTSIGSPADPAATAEDFPALADMTKVREFFVDNLLGDLDATLAVARSEDGGTYPVGSLLQLVPGEAMVKRAEGFSPGTKDWEFFELDVSAEGTSIRVRGGVEAVNRFGGSCADCHAKAEPQYDFVCELDHGCDPLGLNRDVIRDIQESDPRPRATS